MDTLKHPSHNSFHQKSGVFQSWPKIWETFRPRDVSFPWPTTGRPVHAHEIAFPNGGPPRSERPHQVSCSTTLRDHPLAPICLKVGSNFKPFLCVCVWYRLRYVTSYISGIAFGYKQHIVVGEYYVWTSEMSLTHLGIGHLKPFLGQFWPNIATCSCHTHR